MLLMRKTACGVCGFYPIVDTEAQVQHCFCMMFDSLPQWVIISPYQLRQWKKQYRGISKELFDKQFELIKHTREVMKEEMKP